VRGIHSVDEATAFRMPRDHSRPANRMLVALATAELPPLRVAIVGAALRSVGPLSFRAIHDQGSGGSEAPTRRKDQLRATKLKQVARRIKDGSSKARLLTPVKRAAEAGRDYRRARQ
jgi:hypothetical protein